jgi:hypothetical protein
MVKSTHNNHKKEVSRMEINVRDDERIIEIWLTNEEKNNREITRSLNRYYDMYRHTKYNVAVFQSGGNNLNDFTAGLLLHNRINSVFRNQF